MNNIEECIAALLEIDGATGAALVDCAQLCFAGAAHRPGRSTAAEVTSRAMVDAQAFLHQVSLLNNLGTRERIQSLVFIYDSEIAILWPLRYRPLLCLYLRLNRSVANLASAQHVLADIEELLVVDQEASLFTPFEDHAERTAEA